MDLRFGGGVPEVLLDLTTQELQVYGSAEQAETVHARYGGQQFYFARSGLSGAGWIPKSFGVRKVSTYRVDTFYVEAPSLDVSSLGGLHLPSGECVLVPVAKRTQIASDWPIFVFRGLGSRRGGEREVHGYEQLMLLDQRAFQLYLRGEVEVEEREETFRFVPQPGGRYSEPEYVERVFSFLAPKGVKRLNFRRALTGVFLPDLEFEGGEECRGQGPLEDAEFWRPLVILGGGGGRL